MRYAFSYVQKYFLKLEEKYSIHMTNLVKPDNCSFVDFNTFFFLIAVAVKEKCIPFKRTVVYVAEEIDEKCVVLEYLENCPLEK